MLNFFKEYQELLLESLIISKINQPDEYCLNENRMFIPKLLDFQLSKVVPQEIWTDTSSYTNYYDWIIKENNFEYKISVKSTQDVDAYPRPHIRNPLKKTKGHSVGLKNNRPGCTISKKLTGNEFEYLLLFIGNYNKNYYRLVIYDIENVIKYQTISNGGILFHVHDQCIYTVTADNSQILKIKSNYYLPRKKICRNKLFDFEYILSVNKKLPEYCI